MQLFLRDLQGSTVTLEANAQQPVGDLKALVAEVSDVPSSEQCLIFGGRSLTDLATLEECGLEEGSTVFLNSELSGGGKKRKKKTYTKPKKIKHKRKKVKLAVLKFYKVDSNDKVTRLRRECPQEQCGPGVFMAMHFNRYYCGKCYLTYLIKKDG
mmetsp:Transcript_48604/g.59782  ORF Transcript_48604/g.59782 Transcript_48604/m.59782 type:complete len:155 (+) Transcript_48604:63-527(+)